MNAISKNLLICDRKRLISPHAFYLGVSGSGKSVGMKGTVNNVILSTDDEVIIIDAEREYGPLTRSRGGVVVEISPNSPTTSTRWRWRWSTWTGKTPSP